MSQTRIALVTGANRGIGLEIARQLARLGIATVIGSRSLAKGQEAAARLKAEGGVLDAVELDVADGASVARAVAEIERRFGRIDILVNNAGILLDQPTSVFDVTPEVVARQFDVNAVGPLRTMQAVVPGMRRRGYGRVVNMSSTLAQLKDMAALRPGYRMSKVALNALTRLSAAEIGPGDVKINCMSPGWVQSDMGGPQAPRTLAEGADTAVWLATLPADGPSGGFFDNRQPIDW